MKLAMTQSLKYKYRRKEIFSNLNDISKSTYEGIHVGVTPVFGLQHLIIFPQEDFRKSKFCNSGSWVFHQQCCDLLRQWL